MSLSHDFCLDLYVTSTLRTEKELPPARKIVSIFASTNLVPSLQFFGVVLLLQTKFSYSLAFFRALLIFVGDRTKQLSLRATEIIRWRELRVRVEWAESKFANSVQQSNGISPVTFYHVSTLVFDFHFPPKTDLSNCVRQTRVASLKIDSVFNFTIDCAAAGDYSTSPS